MGNMRKITLLKVRILAFRFNCELKHLLPNLKNKIFLIAFQSYFVKYCFIKKLQLIKKSKN